MKKSQLRLSAVLYIVLICFAPEFCQAEELELRVIVQKANIRLRADAVSEIILQVSIGTVLKSDTREGNWYRVILPPDENGIEKSGYVHSNIVEVLPKQVNPQEVEPKEPEREFPKTVENVEDAEIKPAEMERIPDLVEPPKAETEPFFTRLLKKVSLKISGGPGFFFNGAGDLDKLRLETEDYISAMGEPPDPISKLNRHKLATLEGVPSYESEYIWNPLRTNAHFQYGLNYDITNHFSIGISSGVFRARNDDVQYSYGHQLSQEEEWWTLTEKESASYLEDHNLRATPWFLNFSYSSNPGNSPARLSPEFSLGVGPVFARIERNFIEELNYNADFTSPYYANGWDHEWRKTTINGDWRASTLGAQISGGIDWKVAPWMTLGLDGFLFLANFKNWKGSEEGNWEWGLQKSNEDSGGVYQDESDSGGWDYGPDAPLSYDYRPCGQPWMFLLENPPQNGLTPSINWNNLGVEATIKIGLGGGTETTRERGKKPPPTKKAGPKRKKAPVKKKGGKTPEPSPPTNPYSNFKDPNCSCPCCIGLEVYLLVEVEVGGIISIFKDIVTDEFEFGDTDGDIYVEHKRERIIRVNFNNKELENWQRNRVRITIETKAYFDRELPENCCVSGEGSFAGSATIINEDITDTTRVPPPTRRNPNPRLNFALGSCSGDLCCRVTFSPYQLKKSYKLGPLPRINLDGWVFTQVSTYLEK